MLTAALSKCHSTLPLILTVPPRRINEIVLRKRGITADIALRLAVAFGTSEGFWLGLQADYDLEEARKAIKGQLSNIVQCPPAGSAHKRHGRQHCSNRDTIAWVCMACSPRLLGR